MTTPLDLVADNRKWVRLHENNAHQAEAARRMAALLAEIDRLAATVDRVRELMGRMHEFAHTTGPCGHGCSGCVTARWEHDLRAAIEGTDS